MSTYRIYMIILFYRYSFKLFTVSMLNLTIEFVNLVISFDRNYTAYGKKISHTSKGHSFDSKKF